jgi:transcriptional regulator with XRE-family HTH domain
MLSKMVPKSKKTQKFCDNLKQLVRHHEVSVRKMSRAINLDRAHLNRLMQGKHSSPGLESLEKIADFFKISVGQLIGEQEINFGQLPKLNVDLDGE